MHTYTDPFHQALMPEIGPGFGQPAGVARGLPKTKAIRGLSPQRICYQALLIIGLLFINKAGAPGTVVFYLLMFWMVAKSPESAFKGLTIGMLAIAANTAICPKSFIMAPGRLLLLVVASLRFFADLQAQRKSLFRYKYYLAFNLFCLVTGLCSIAGGYYINISMLKLATFWIGVSGILSAVEVIRKRQSDLTEWFVAMAAAITLLGIYSRVAGIGFNMLSDKLQEKGLFNGPFYHSNALGPFAVAVVAFLASVWLYGKYKNRWICLVLAIFLIYFITLTRSRTSVVSLILGLLSGYACSLTAVRKLGTRLRRNTSAGSLFGYATVFLLVIVVGDTLTSGRIYKSVIAFANKGGDGGATIDLKQVMQSREALINQSWELFKSHPITGIGFQVSYGEEFRKKATLLSAPVEKGFLPTAVLEETGILGTSCFVIFIVGFLGYLIGQRNIPGTTVFLAVLFTNLGEVQLFALGGPGQLGWILTGAAMILGDHCFDSVNVFRWRPSSHIEGAEASLHTARIPA